MKIGIVSPGGFDRSGRERVIPAFLWFVERLARRHEVHIYTLYQNPKPDRYPLLGATVHNLGYRRRRPGMNQMAQTLRAIGSEHRRGHFDVLHGLWATESGLIAALAGRMARLPSVVTVMCGELVALPAIGYGAQLRPASRYLVGLTLRLAGIVTSESEYARRLLQQHRPDARLLTLGVDLDRFCPPEHLEPGPPWRLLHVASLNRVKDQPTLLQAFAMIHAAEPATHLDLIGEDTLHGEIPRYAADLGLSGAVTFHAFQPTEVVAERMRRSHLLLHSSLSEAAPLVFLEAAACGVPTVGTAVGLIADAAPNAAFAVPVGDAPSMAKATLHLLRSPEDRSRMGRNALAFAQARDADRTACDLEALYHAARWSSGWSKGEGVQR
jgi:glycosyltransferase involved in cell wall biosynthesis